MDVQTRIILGVQALLFGVAKDIPELGEETRARLLTAARESKRALAKAMAEAEGAAEGAADPGVEEKNYFPTVVLRKNDGDGKLLTFGPVSPQYRFAGGVDGLDDAAQAQVRQYMNGLIARARGVWHQWAGENGCAAALDFVEDRRVLQFAVNGQKVNHCIGFELTKISEPR
jgi:Sec-independent protein translocase protein TatA